MVLFKIGPRRIFLPTDTPSALAALLPTGRLFGGVDEFPGVDHSLSVATLPQTYLDTTMPDLTGMPVLAVTGSGTGSDLQAQLDAAMAAGAPRVVLCPDGATYQGLFLLCGKADTSMTYLMSESAYRKHAGLSSLFPAAATRIARAERSLCFGIGSGAIGPALRSNRPSGSFVRIVGASFDTDAFANSSFMARLGAPTYDDGSPDLGGVVEPNAPANTPQWLIVDRCVFTQGVNGCRMALAMNGRSMACIDSYFDPIWITGTEGRAIGTLIGPGPFKYVNNHLSGASQHILFGGGSVLAESVLPADIEVRCNSFSWPAEWYQDGVSRVSKTHFEVKQALRVLLTQNHFQHHFENNGGFLAPITIKSENSNASTSYQQAWSRSNDITILANWIEDCQAFMSIVAEYPENGDIIERWECSYNLGRRIGVDGPYPGPTNGALFALTGGDRNGGTVTARVRRNTAPCDVTSGATNRAFRLTGPAFAGMTITDNILYGTIRSDEGYTPGDAAVAGHFPSRSLTRNVFVEATVSGSGTLSGHSGIADEGNAFVQAAGGVGFEDYANGDLRVAADSPFAAFGEGGSAPGADVDYLEAATAGCLTGEWE